MGCGQDYSSCLPLTMKLEKNEELSDYCIKAASFKEKTFKYHFCVREETHERSLTYANTLCVYVLLLTVQNQ